MKQDLILVDERNRAVGWGEKANVHRTGLLHRAFSIFLVDPSGRVLLQQRSRAKYHSGGLWANACCGHPRPGERTLPAARRRLGEELNTRASLRFAFRARYRTELSNGLIENEIVYVYFGLVAEPIIPNPDEVAAVVWLTLADLKADLARRPRQYAYWFRYYLKNHFAAIARAAALTKRV